MAVEWERDGKPCEVQLWDTAGQEALSQLRSVAYPDTDVFLLAYDMTRKDSLENISTWLDEVQDECSDYDRIILVGTKYDLWCERKEAGEDAALVEVQEVEKIAEEIEASDTAFTSARTGYGFPNSDGLQYDGENEDEDEPDLRQLILGVESGESEESVEVLAAELETPEGTAAGEDAEAAAEDADVGAEDADAPAEDADAVGSREALELEIEEAAQQKDYKRAAELQRQLAALDAEEGAEDAEAASEDAEAAAEDAEAAADDAAAPSESDEDHIMLGEWIAKFGDSDESIAAFHEYDTDGDDKISSAELEEFCESEKGKRMYAKANGTDVESSALDKGSNEAGVPSSLKVVIVGDGAIGKVCVALSQTWLFVSDTVGGAELPSGHTDRVVCSGLGRPKM